MLVGWLEWTESDETDEDGFLVHLKATDLFMGLHFSHDMKGDLVLQLCECNTGSSSSIDPRVPKSFLDGASFFHISLPNPMK